MLTRKLLSLAVLSLAVACGNDDPTPNNLSQGTNNETNGRSNNTTIDVGVTATDMGEDQPVADMDLTDLGEDQTVTDIGVDMAVASDAAAQIALVRGGLLGTVSGAVVTYIKEGLGSDAPGFFVQATAAGPALFIESTDAVIIGQTVAFEVANAAIAAEGFPKVTAITGLKFLGFGYDVTSLTQDVSAATDLVTNLSDYELELIDAAVTVTTAFSESGSMYSSAGVETVGVKASNDLRLRVPSTIVQAYGLEAGCTLNINDTPLWRSTAQAQIRAQSKTELSNIVCPVPVLNAAVSARPAEVVLTFSRPIDPASVSNAASQFVINQGLSVLSAAVRGNQITLTTTAQVKGTLYTIAVADTVHDVLGASVSATGNSKTFVGFNLVATLRINEIAADICGAVEFRVVSGGSVNGFEYHERQDNKFSFPDVVVATDDIIILHFKANSSSCGYVRAINETTSITEFPKATNAPNYDTAWDFFTTQSNLMFTDNTLTLFDANGVIQDGVLVGCRNPLVANYTSEEAAVVLVANGQWQNNDGTVPAGGYIDDVFCANAVPGLPDSTIFDSMQRINDGDNNDKSDWTPYQTTSTFGLLNVGQTAF